MIRAVWITLLHAAEDNLRQAAYYHERQAVQHLRDAIANLERAVQLLESEREA